MTDTATGLSSGPETTVLVVEDELLIRLNVAMTLEAAGYRVWEANSGAAGLEQLSLHPEIMVLFTDINMPGAFDGLELARRVHALQPDVHLILTSGLMRPGIQELSGGVFIAKPYDDEGVTHLIEIALAGAKLH